jgi:hypothetical protein
MPAGLVDRSLLALLPPLLDSAVNSLPVRGCTILALKVPFVESALILPFTITSQLGRRTRILIV